MVKVSLHDDVYEEIDDKEFSEDAIMGAPRQWKRHLKKIR